MPWREIDDEKLVAALVRGKVRGSVVECSITDADEGKSWSLEIREYETGTDSATVVVFDLVANQPVAAFVWINDDRSEDWNEPFWCEHCRGRLHTCRMAHSDYRLGALTSRLEPATASKKWRVK